MDFENKAVKKRKSQKEEKHPEEVKDKVLVRAGELPVKVFEDRQSVLTELFDNIHVQSVYHLFISLFVALCLNSIVHDYLYDGKIRFGYNLVSKGFRNMHLMAIAWFFIFFLSLVPYYGIKYWAQIRSTLKANSFLLYFWDRLCLIIYVTHLFVMLGCSTAISYKWDMGFAATISLVMETLRMVMKIYSFGRVCVSRVLSKTEKHDKHPKMSHYLYYSFAPTLLYRDSYPRLPGKVKWSKVLVYFIEFVAAILFLGISFERFVISQFQDYGSKHIPLKDIVMATVNNVPYGFVVMATVNYILLHLWLNAFAEMMRFSDRLFYKDWWTSTTYERYYRTWNTTVHDWLYTYIYKDFFEIVLPKRKMIGKVAVFFISSVFHDYVMTMALGYFLPVYFINFFVVGEIVAYLKFPNNLIGNVFLLFTMGLGASIMITVYTLEYYSRLHCFKDDGNMIDIFSPKFVQCYK